jgi:hypothetical protein
MEPDGPKPDMKPFKLDCFRRMVVVGCLMVAGCSRYSAPLELTTMDPSQDQWKIAAYYSQEADKLRQKAEELSARAAVYERLFGPESDWVTGTRLLAQSYEEAARDHERLAEQHLELAGGRRSPRYPMPASR